MRALTFQGHEDVHQGFVHDTFSAFYPLTEASATIRSFHLEDYGLVWRHAPAVLDHPTPDGEWAILGGVFSDRASAIRWAKEVAASREENHWVLKVRRNGRWVDIDKPHFGLFGRHGHTHDFSAVEGNRTNVTDHVESKIPKRMLHQMFRYRHSQLAADLAEHRWAAPQNNRTLAVAMTGSSGPIETALFAFLSTGGHRIIRLVCHTNNNERNRVCA